MIVSNSICDLENRINVLENTLEDRVNDIQRLQKDNQLLLAELSIYKYSEVTTDYPVLADEGRTIELLKQLGRKQ